MTEPFHVGGVEISQGGPLFLIAGPCVIEDRQHTLTLARQIAEVCEAEGMPLIFKASYDKANRTTARSYRGPGLERGCEILAEVKATFGLPVLTDVHEVAQAEPAAQAGIDCLQVPAYLCRQTDLIQAVAQTGRPVNLKKGQFMAPQGMESAIEKVREEGNRQVMVTERGTFFGYSNLVNDMTAIPILSRTGAPVVFDGTHSVQQPFTMDGRTGGNRALVPTLVRAAVAAGCHGLFLEVHEQPERAPSDAANMLPLHELAPLLRSVLRIRAALASADPVRLEA